MCNSIQACLCNQFALEDSIPVGDRQLACQDECFPVVPVVDDLLEVMLRLSLEPDHPEVVYDDQAVV